MTTNNDGGQAFPVPGLPNSPNGEFIYPMTGMPLRDYFAAKVITECLSCCATITRAAEEAYKIADAMLEARK